MTCTCAKTPGLEVVDPACPQHIGRLFICYECGKRWWSHFEASCPECYLGDSPPVWREYLSKRLHARNV